MPEGVWKTQYQNLLPTHSDFSGYPKPENLPRKNNGAASCLNQGEEPKN